MFRFFIQIFYSDFLFRFCVQILCSDKKVNQLIKCAGTPKYYTTNSRNRFEFIFVEETLRSLEENGIKLIGQFRNRINEETRRAIALTALSLGGTLLNLNYTRLRSDKAHCTKADNGSRLLFKHFCSRKQLTDGAAFL